MTEPAVVKQQNHYVDNKKLFALMKQYRHDVGQAEAADDDKPMVPEYVGKCILMIANRLSMKPQFVNYSYREEMISDGIENCISYIDNFDPEKSENPFAYFTQIIYFAFLRRIAKEKKQMYVKHKMVEQSAVEFIHQSEFEDHEVTTTIDLNNEAAFDFIKNFEDNLAAKRVARKKGLEKFVEVKEEEE
jgi:DNA-directed RNA polymerase specialized sigma24 family protein